VFKKVQTTQSTQRVMLDRLWTVLAEADRQRTLRTLSRVVVQQLLPPAKDKEVAHEDS
jgi:hypothetical protein